MNAAPHPEQAEKWRRPADRALLTVRRQRLLADLPNANDDAVPPEALEALRRMIAHRFRRSRRLAA